MKYGKFLNGANERGRAHHHQTINIDSIDSTTIFTFIA